MNQSVKLQKKQAVDKSKRFEIDVLEGLKSYPKSLPSKYFYDDAGDRLFQKITTLNEYYLTRCEKEILHDQAADIANLISTSKQLRIIELGAGDGHKTIPFLKRLSDFGLNFDFVPVDISEDVLNQLASRFKETLPLGSVHPFAADYFNVDFPEHDGATLWMYMGSTIGNLPRDKAIGLLKNLHESAKEADIFALGYDLRKDPTTILAAYNDSHGITAAFNLNLLTRINRELGANFELANWKHYPIYDVVTGEARSYLVSQKKQAVFFPNTDESIEFEPWEAIHTEISKKFSRIEMDEICTLAGWKPKTILTDNAQHYALSFYQFNP
jgi:L-histidine N-alpha-methyltransferase